MFQSSPRRSVRPTLEALEDRCTPAGTVTGSLAGGVWRLTGDDNVNYIKVTSAGKPGAFTVTGLLTGLAGVTNPTGVHKIVFDLKGHNDSAELSDARLASVVFNGGEGHNVFIANRFALTGELRVVNGVGADTTNLTQFKIGGDLSITNGNGGSSINLGNFTVAAGFNSIAGNVKISNGVGEDFADIRETDVGRNIVVDNGAGDGAAAGHFQMLNIYQSARRAVVGGNISVRFQNGDSSVVGNRISDVVVRGNVLFNNGSGAVRTAFDANATRSPVTIAGRLTIAGTGTNVVAIGQAGRHTGLRVGKNFVIDVLNPTDLTLQAFNLFVAGQTKVV